MIRWILNRIPNGDMLKKLVGREVEKIFFNENNLKFETDDGSFLFGVTGDCCSRSIFYDFYGVKKLLENGKVISVRELPIEYGNVEDKNKAYEDESVKAYGYELVTEDPKFGDVTSVFSFRNYSNGYYGGEMYGNDGLDFEVWPQIFDDVIGD